MREAAPNHTGTYKALLHGTTGAVEAMWMRAAALYGAHPEGDPRVTHTGLYKNYMAAKQDWGVLLDREYVSITALKYF